MDTLMSPVLSLPAQGATEQGSRVSQRAVPFHPCAQGDGDRQGMLSWGLGSERGREFSCKPALSIHTQDHISVRGRAGGPVQGWETTGISAKSCSHLHRCWVTAQDRAVGSEATRDVGTATTGATPSLGQSNPLGSVVLGLPGLRAGAGAAMDILVEGWLGLASPQCPSRSQEQAGVDRGAISQEKPWGSGPVLGADVEAPRHELGLNLVAQGAGMHCPGSPCPQGGDTFPPRDLQCTFPEAPRAPQLQQLPRSPR